VPPVEAVERRAVAQRLEAKEERELLRVLGQFPDVVKGAAEAQEPQRVPAYLAQVAGAFHQFYHQHRVVTRGRRALARAPPARARHAAGDRERPRAARRVRPGKDVT
jgi:arginyl-tRNA synthetase